MRKKKLTSIGIALIGVLTIAWSLQHFRGDGNAIAMTHAIADDGVPVKIAVATRSDVELSLQAVARAEAWSTVTVRARSSGQLQSLGFTPGEKISKGSLLAQIDPTLFKAQLDQARGNVAVAQAQLAKAQTDFQRYSEVLAKGFVSRADFDAYKANVAVAGANLQTSLAAQELVQAQLGYTRIVAPFDGVAGAPQVWPGAQVIAGNTDIVILNQIDPIRIVFSIPEDRLAAVRAAQVHGKVMLQAQLPGDSAAPLSGTLDFIDNAIDASTGTIVLKGRFDNAEARLTPGQFLEVILPTTHLAAAVSVPVEALQSSDRGDFVFVVGVDGKAHQRYVEIGANSGGRTVIEKGLAPGERVVTDGQLRLSDGSAARIVDGA